jgi:hypothetical protein
MTSVVLITPARVRAIIDAYGGDPRRWPLAERAAAEALIAAAPAQFADTLHAARALDALLDSDRDIAPGEGAVLRATRAMMARQPHTQKTPRGAFVALAAAAIAGLGVGLLLPPAYDAEQITDNIVLADALGATGAFEETP